MISIVGMSGNSADNTRICGSTASTIDPFTARSHYGDSCEASTPRTVLRENPEAACEGLDRHLLSPMQPADLRPVLHVQHLPIVQERSTFSRNHTGEPSPGTGILHGPNAAKQ